MSWTRFSMLALILFFLLSSSALLPAQDASGSIRGTVFDSTGGRIAQASIVIVNTATGLRFATTSDAEGGFAFDLLQPGDYSARVTARNMSPQVTPQLHVDVGAGPSWTFNSLSPALTRMSRSPARQRWSNPRPARSRLCSMSAR